MSDALKVPNARQLVEAAYDKMLSAYEMYYRMQEDHYMRDNYKCYYNEQSSKYKELCTVVVERLMRENPKVLEDMHILYLS
jgi:hypothetical protein